MARIKSDWKLFELFVTDLEQLYDSDPNVKITSNDNVRDCDGSMRQLDCSIRFEKGLTKYFAFFECRNRKSSSDITWVEQVKEKRDAIGANKAILVHRKNISHTALKKAKRYGIDFRLLKKVDHQERKMIMPHLSMVTASFKIASANITLAQCETTDQAHNWLKNCANTFATDRVIWDPYRSELISAQELIALNGEELGIPSSELPGVCKDTVSFQSSGNMIYLLNVENVNTVINRMTFEITTVVSQVDVNHYESAQYFRENTNPINVEQYIISGIDELMTTAGVYHEKPSSLMKASEIELSIGIKNIFSSLDKQHQSDWQRESTD